MKRFVLLLSILWIFGGQVLVAQEVVTARPLLLAHYMPWYQTREVSGFWGWHWTMNHFNPDRTDENGRPEFASHYMPLTGLYDSQDEAVLEYQVLLMKLSGIDGVIVDWYGIENFRDYAILNESTGKLFEAVKKTGLKFVICYEDQTIMHMVNENHISEDETHQRGQEDMRYLQETWFTDDAYLKVNGQPILFVFGPQYFRTPPDWEKMFEGLETTPALVTLDKHMDWAALSSYPWPPMHMAGGATLAPAALESYLNLFYRNARRRDYIVGSAFPAFHDIYEEAGVRSSYGYLDPQDGDTFRKTLELALASNPQIIQLVTWNDYGEGTIIEPTEETGYQYLEIVQETRRALDPTFSFTPDDLRLPLQFFEFKKVNREGVDQLFDAIASGHMKLADDLLQAFRK